MDGIGKHAAFYRAYLPHDRSLVPGVGRIGRNRCAVVEPLLGQRRAEPEIVQKEARAAAVLVCRPVSH